MIDRSNGFVDQYASALKKYLDGADERALEYAYELGRRAITDGLGGVDLAYVHQEALLRILQQTQKELDPRELIRLSYTFFTESFSPIEMTHRGFLDALISLRSSEERYRTLVESARDVIYTLSVEGTITSLNPAFETLTGWSRAEWLGKSFVPLIHPDDLYLGMEMFQRVVRGEAPPMFELRVHAASGEYLIGEFTTTPQVRGSEIIGVLGIARDVTERKKAEEKIRQSEELFRLITENAGDMIALVDLEGRREYNSPSYRSLLGDPDRLRGTDSFQDIHEDDRERIRKIFFETVRTGVGRRTEYRLKTRDGGVRIIESQGNLIRDSHGKPLRVVVVSRDVTERKKAVEQLKESERRLARAEQMAHLGSWEWNIPSNKVTWSEELYRIYGLKTGEFEGTYQEFLRHVHPEDQARVARTIEQAYKTKQPFRFEERIILPDGSVKVLESRGEVVVDEKGNVVKMFGSCLDITPWKETQKALNDLAKRVVDAQEEERRRIARELHDDVCQRLTGLKFIVDDIHTAVPKEKHSALKAIQSTKREIDRLIVEVRRMSAHLRPTALDDFGLVVALRRLCEEFQKLHKLKITFIRHGVLRDHYEADIEIALYRIAQEALFNAVKHSQATKASVRITDNGTMLVLEIQDNGRGISRRDRESAKSNRRGLGLLSMHERAKLLGGIFTLESTPQKGTTVRVEIPLTTETP